MAEETTETTETTESEGISEEELRAMIGDELDSRISTITDSIGGIADSIVEKLKGEGGSTSEEGLLDKIGTMIDDKLKALPNGTSEKKPREPKIRIFG